LHPEPRCYNSPHWSPHLKLSIVPRDRPHQPEIVWAAFSLLLVATGVVKAYFPALADRFMPGCFLKDQLGVRCPTCGTGTSLMLLSEGKLVEAIETSWIAPFMLAALALFDLYLLGTFVVRRKAEVKLTRRDSIVIALAGFLALGISWVHQLFIRP
jgi:hypothetical protein